MKDNSTIAERLGSLSLRMQSPHDEVVRAAGDEVKTLVVSLDPLETADDALAMQCFAMDLARMLADGVVPLDGAAVIIELMRCAMVRAGRYLETVASSTMAERAFVDWNAPALVVH